jgi:hypothetical protein
VEIEGCGDLNWVCLCLRSGISVVTSVLISLATMSRTAIRITLLVPRSKRDVY